MKQILSLSIILIIFSLLVTNRAYGQNEGDFDAATSSQDITTASQSQKIEPIIAATDTTKLLSTAARQKVIALTFDDGPDGTLTPAALEALSSFKVHATFCVQGQWVQVYPQITRQIVAGGNEVCNHSWRHSWLTDKKGGRVYDDLEQTQTAIYSAANTYPKFYRPLYGAENKTVVEQASLLGLRPILWTCDPKDWRNPGSKTILARIKKCASDGGVVILHDTHKGTIEALPDILVYLKEQGYHFVTVTEVVQINYERSLLHENGKSKR